MDGVHVAAASRDSPVWAPQVRGQYPPGPVGPVGAQPADPRRRGGPLYASMRILLARVITPRSRSVREPKIESAAGRGRKDGELLGIPVRAPHNTPLAALFSITRLLLPHWLMGARGTKGPGLLPLWTSAVPADHASVHPLRLAKGGKGSARRRRAYCETL
jgi:hypothetical protein